MVAMAGGADRALDGIAFGDSAGILLCVEEAGVATCSILDAYQDQYCQPLLWLGTCGSAQST